MKLLYIYRYLLLGGVTTQLTNRLPYLQEHAEVHFAFLRNYGGRSALPSDAYVHVPETVEALAELICRHGFDCIISIDTEEAYEAVSQASYKGPLIHEVHTTTKSISYLSRLTERNDIDIDALLVPSEYVHHDVHENYGFQTVPSYVLPNCLDTTHFYPRETAHIPERPIVLWVGKMDDHKNWRGFLTIAQKLRERGNDCLFWMVGGETAPEAVASELFQTVQQMGLGNSFRWLQRVEYDDMPRLYSLVSNSGGLTISTSRNESFGMTIAEALACGCPTVAPNVGAIGEVMDGFFSEFLYPFFNESDATERVERILRDNRIREQIRWQGITRVQDRYNSERIGQLNVTIIRNVIQNR